MNSYIGTIKGKLSGYPCVWGESQSNCDNSYLGQWIVNLHKLLEICVFLRHLKRRRKAKVEIDLVCQSTVLKMGHRFNWIEEDIK